MARNMIQYRGSLKSCNYGCSYCPFAKRPSSPTELLKDREDWMRFVRHLETQSERLETFSGQTDTFSEPYGAVMVVPYGEALIHDYYWEGLARLSRMGTMEAVGAQTNLSFDIERQLTIFKESGGRKEKLRVWATFHPEMTTVPLFSEQCRELLSAGIRVCAGAVGVPENLETLRRLKEALPGGCCLWINRMDGLNRRYTEEERQAFLRIDPWFYRELHVKKAMPEQCPGRLFVESDGRMRRCTISAPPEGNWYDTGGTETLPCRKKACTCYLAYGGRMDCEERTAFGRWPLFRIPWSPRAVFLDLDGTLIPENGRMGDRLLPHPGISGEWLDFFKRESLTRFLFLATSLPWKEAAAKCRSILPYISGGVFAGGAHVFFRPGEDQPWKDQAGKDHAGDYRHEIFHTFNAPWLPQISALQSDSRSHFRLRLFEHEGRPYKLTLTRPQKCGWTQEDVKAVISLLTPGAYRCFTERGNLQIVSREVDKGSGVRELCALMGIDPRETAAVGDSEEDTAMFRTCGYGIAVKGGSPKAAAEADFIAECCPKDIRFHTQVPHSATENIRAGAWLPALNRL